MSTMSSSIAVSPLRRCDSTPRRPAISATCSGRLLEPRSSNTRTRWGSADMMRLFVFLDVAFDEDLRVDVDGSGLDAALHERVEVALPRAGIDELGVGGEIGAQRAVP